MRHSRTPFDHLGAWEGGGAHREFHGGGRGVREGLEGGRSSSSAAGEREGAGEVESNQVETKTQNLSYLRMRRVTEKLTGASASLIRHRSSGTTAAVVSFMRRTEKGEKEGCGSSL